MSTPPEKTRRADFFERPATVFLFGTSRPLLDWVAYALASQHTGGFIWTDVRLEGELPDENGPLARDLVRNGRLHVVPPERLTRDDLAGNVGVGGFVRTDVPSESVRRLADFLRLPPGARREISQRSHEGHSVVFVLSNAHHMTPFYPPGTLAPTIRAFVEFGASLLVTFPATPGEGRFAYDYVGHLVGLSPERWRDAVLQVEKGESSGPLRTGANLRLEDLLTVASVLSRSL